MNIKTFEFEVRKEFEKYGFQDQENIYIIPRAGHVSIRYERNINDVQVIFTLVCDDINRINITEIVKKIHNVVVFRV